MSFVGFMDWIPSIAVLIRVDANPYGPIAAKVTLGMEPPDAEKFIGSNTMLRLDDGTPTPIGLQGHGLQRAVIFALLEVLATQKARIEPEEGGDAANRGTILLFEEPELFIHPHLMRRLKEVLQTIAKRDDWQVVASTHSPFLVDVGDDPQSLIIHRRSSPITPPVVTQLHTDPFIEDGTDEDRERLRAVLDFHPTVCESFFAKHVVLVEGDTEIATLVKQPKLYRAACVDEDLRRNVTVVSCDGKWTIVPIARLLRAFGIPTRVIHDRDKKEETDKSLAEKPWHPFHANARIAEVVGDDAVQVIDDTFEHVLWEPDDAPQSTKDKPYRRQYIATRGQRSRAGRV